VQCTAAQWVTQSKVQLPKAGAHTQSAYFVTAADSGTDSLDDADMDGKNGVSTLDDNDVVMPPSSKRCRPSAADGVACTADPHQDFFNFCLFSYARFCMPCNKLIGGSYQDSQSHMQQAHKP
jgi:hypothetical protein